MNESFEAAIPLLKKIEESGFEAYFVGGAVRDYLLNRPINDVDIATSATPEEIKMIFQKTIDVGIQHGTVAVLHEGIPYEITTFRSESAYADFRRPDKVEFIRSLEDDLMRRDFTMNAIAMDWHWNIIDPFHGRKSLDEKMIVTVGKAEERFSEDALRMLRAVRFSSQLSFQIENQTVYALSAYSHLLEKIAVERKKAEFEKLMAGKNRRNALSLVKETGLHQYLPGMESKDFINLSELPCEQLTVDEMWALLLLSLGNDRNTNQEILRKWLMPVKQMKHILKILDFYHIRRNRNWSQYEMYLGKEDVLISAEKLNLTILKEPSQISLDEIRDRYKSLKLKDRSELEVSGNDIMNWTNKQGGPWLKELFVKMEEAILEGELQNEKDHIKEWLMKCNRK